MFAARTTALSGLVAALLLAGLVAALVLVGCGSSGSLLTHSQAAPMAHNHPHVKLPDLRRIPAPPATGRIPDPAALRVIVAWSRALQRGNVRAAASFFNLPSEFINGGGGSAVPVIRIGTLAQAEAVNAALPCGATLLSADQRGRYVNALFKLTGRSGPGGTSCGSGAGSTARTNFLIEDGKIVEWIRAPDDPGDNGSPAPGNPSSPGGTPLV